MFWDGAGQAGGRGGVELPAGPGVRVGVGTGTGGRSVIGAESLVVFMSRSLYIAISESLTSFLFTWVSFALKSVESRDPSASASRRVALSLSALVTNQYI